MGAIGNVGDRLWDAIPKGWAIFYKYRDSRAGRVVLGSRLIVSSRTTYLCLLHRALPNV